jgi:membrane-bound lytic murein transglycosylase B
VNKLSLILSIACAALVVVADAADAKPKAKAKAKAARKAPQATTYPLLGNSHSKYRGWDYLAGQLRKAGVKESDISAIYSDPMMPRFTFVPFKVKPREPHSIYASFDRDSFAQLGASFIEEYDHEFNKMERTYNVPREIVTAILVIETQIGKYTGKEMIVHRLSRLAAVLDPNNVQENYRRLKATDPSVTLEDVKKRGTYLEETFLPEIPALIEISRRNQVNVFHILGSSAGAFGIPQFLPTAFIKYGVDGDGDGHVSLFNKVDALWSAGNYLAAFGYKPDLAYAERRKVIWEYNRSDAYIDTVFRVAARIRNIGVMGCRRQRATGEAEAIRVGWCPEPRE